MTKTLERESAYPISADRLLEALLDPALLAERHRQQGAVTAEVQDGARNGTRLVQEVALTEYARTTTGRLDTSRTEPARVTYDWDLDARACTWSYAGPFGERLELGGEMRVFPAAAGGSRLASRFRVRVRVPLIAGMVEKMVLSELEQGVARNEEALRRFVDRLG